MECQTETEGTLMPISFYPCHRRDTFTLLQTLPNLALNTCRDGTATAWALGYLCLGLPTLIITKYNDPAA